MTLNLPQTYLIGLCSLLLVIAILVGRQLYKVRKDELKLIKFVTAKIKQCKIIFLTII